MLAQRSKFLLYRLVYSDLKNRAPLMTSSNSLRSHCHQRLHSFVVFGWKQDALPLLAASDREVAQDARGSKENTAPTFSAPTD